MNNNDLEQLKIAFPNGDECPYCGKWIDPENPPVRLLVALVTGELFCSMEHFELYRSSLGTPLSKLDEGEVATE